MIKVKIDKNKIQISGHAYYDDLGYDIVCASVSSIVITTINAIVDIDEDSIEYEDLDNKIVINVLKEDEIVNKLLNNMILLLEQLANDYKDCVKIYKEVI